MSIHGKYIARVVVLMMLLCGTIVSASSVKLRVGSTEIVEGNGMLVQLVAEGDQIEFPDIADVGGFPTEGNSVSSKTESSYINGKFSSVSQEILSFSFFPETDMTIPAYTVKIAGKEYKTKPLKISVIPASKVTAKTANGYSLTIKSDKHSVFVGEPFVITVDFFEPQSSSVAKVEYTPPKFKGFFSQALGDEKLKRLAKGTTHELKYLLSAKKDGNFTLMPPKARVAVRDNSGVDRGPFGFFTNTLKWHSVRAKPISISVEALPTKVDLVGIFQMSSSVDKSIIKANSPVTYTLKITGEGSLDDIEDPKFDIQGVTVYSDDAKTQSSITAGKVSSSYEKKYVFISDRDFTIPALSLKSFNYKSKESITLDTDEIRITVDSIATPVAQNTKQSTASGISTDAATRAAKAKADKLLQERQAKEEEARNVLEDVDYYKKLFKENSIGYTIWHLLVAFFAGVFSTMLYVKVSRYITNRKVDIRQKQYTNKESLSILYPHINSSPEIEEMVRKLYELEGGDKSIVIDKRELTNMLSEVLSR